MGNELLKRLDNALSLDPQTASDREWSTLLAEAMNARAALARSRTITKEQVEVCAEALCDNADYPIEAHSLALAAARAFGLTVEG